MAEYGITEEGFVIKPREQIVLDISNSLQTAFGTSFDVSPSSPDGQVIGIVSDALYEAWLREEASYNAFVPKKTFGQGLDDLVAINGIERIKNRPTTVLCTLTGTAGIIIPEGSKVETIEGLQFTTNTTVALPNDVTVTCTTLGALPVGANEVTVISPDNLIVGWTGVNNSEAGVTGIVRQTDPELRVYRENNTISRGSHTVDAIYQSVANLNLPHIFVDNNATDAPVGGVPPHSIHTIVEGGNRQEIARAIFNNLPAGIGAFGSVQETVLDSQGHPHVIGFDRPTDVSIDAVVTVTLGVGATTDALDIINATVVKHINDLNVGEDVDWSSLFPTILSTPLVTVKSLTIGLTGGSQDTVPILIDAKSRAVTTTTNITVQE